MKIIAYILLCSFTFMHSRCIIPEFSIGCNTEEKTETACGQTSCCSKTCEKPEESSEKPCKKQCGDEKGCDPATCCICCFALVVEPAKFLTARFVETNEDLPGYSNNFNSTYVSSSWNPPEMV